MREYEQGKGDRDPGESNGLRDQTEPSQAVRCYRCGGQGHMSRECRKEGRCFACGEVGHMRADCPGKRGVQSSSRGRGKKGHLNWKGADTQAVRPPLGMFSKSARKFTWTKVKSAVISRRQRQPQVRTRKWGACQQKTLQRTGSWSSMVIHTDEVTVTEDAQPAGNPEASSDSGRPQVRQFNWSPNQALTMMVPVWIGHRQVMAVVDTAAQVTIMSRALSEELGCEAPVEKVQLRNAQQDSWMDGGIHEHFGFQLGGKKYYWDVVEADIGDSFIIGIDFLKSVKCKIDLDGNNLELANGDRIPATMKRNTDSDAVHVSRVLLHRKTTIPPKSMKLVRAMLESPADVPFLLEPKELSSLFAVPVMVEGNGPLKICLVNLGEELISLKRKQNLATAVEIDALVDTEDVEEIREKDIAGCEVRSIQAAGDSVVVQEKPEQSQSESQGREEEQELPEHVRCLYEECRKRLTAEQANFVRELLIEFADAFATHDFDIGRFTIFAHRIRTGKAMSLRKSMRRTPLGFDQEERKTLKAMLDAKVIEPSQSEWASPPVLVRKKDGNWRYCIDFRGLNAVTKRDAYPLPLIEECIDGLADMQWFSALDMNSGYWQIPVAEQDKEKTAFITKYGLFHFLRMPFGLSNAPATFQRTMNLVLSGLIWVNVIFYLDDVNVISRTFQENLANLHVVLSRFRKYGLKLKPHKCVLFKRETAFLGRWVDSAGVHMTDDHVKAVQEWPEPKNRKQVEQFLGFINYHRSFIQDLAKTTAPFYELTGPKAKWRWGKNIPRPSASSSRSWHQCRCWGVQRQMNHSFWIQMLQTLPLVEC